MCIFNVKFWQQSGSIFWGRATDFMETLQVQYGFIFPRLPKAAARFSITSNTSECISYNEEYSLMYVYVYTAQPSSLAVTHYYHLNLRPHPGLTCCPRGVRHGKWSRFQMLLCLALSCLFSLFPPATVP